MYKFLDKINARVTQVILFFLMLFSIIADYLENLIKLPSNWELPVILAALILIVNMLKKLYEVDENTKKLLENLEIDVLTKFDRYDSFYKELTIAMKGATTSLDLTHIRHEPPSSFTNSDKFFDGVQTWCKKNPTGYLRRVTTVCNEDMKNWVRELKRTENEVNNYHVKICEWSTEFPMINMAIIDKKNVFLTLTGDISERTCAILIKDRKAAQYFVQYFDNMWALSKKIPSEL